MIKITNGRKDFELKLSNMLLNVDDNDNEQKPVNQKELLIINSLYEMVKHSVSFIMPQEVSDYESFDIYKNLKDRAYPMDMNVSFEFEFINYDEGFFKIEDHELDFDSTTLIFYIKENDKNINKLRALLGMKNKGNFVFLARLHDGFYEIFPKAYVMENFEIIEELELFENRYFNLKTIAIDEILEKAKKDTRSYLEKQIKEYSSIAFGNAEMQMKNDDIFIPEIFLNKKKSFDHFQKDKIIKQNKSILFNNNLLCKTSIKFWHSYFKKIDKVISKLCLFFWFFYVTIQLVWYLRRSFWKF